MNLPVRALKGPAESASATHGRSSCHLDTPFRQGCVLFFLLYSGAANWVIFPAQSSITGATALYGPLIYEGTISFNVVPLANRKHIASEWDQRAFAAVSEDIGLMLLDAGLLHSGTLSPTLAVFEALPGEASAALLCACDPKIPVHHPVG